MATTFRTRTSPRESRALACITGAILLAGCSDDSLQPDSSTPQLSITAEATWLELEPLPGETNASAVAVNILGQVAGSSGDHAVLWEDEDPAALETLEGQTLGRAVAVNDAGQAAGHVYVDDLPRAVLWEDGTINELGTLQGHDRSLVAGISNGGHVVGTSTVGSSLEGTGFLWHDGQMTELPPLPDDHASNALFVNSSGTAVGESRDTSNDRTTYVLWEDGEVSVIDPTLIHELYLLDGFTDEGDIVFTGGGGEEVLIARDGSLTVVPNPDDDAAWYAAGATSPGGLIMIVFPEDEYGLLVDEAFIPFSPPLLSRATCRAVSDEGHVVCTGGGRAILGIVPLDRDVDSIEGLLDFFDEAISEGTLQGAGPGNSGAGRLSALRQTLEAAALHFEEGRARAGCQQLNQMLRLTDGFPRPPDVAEGPAATLLADHLRAMIDQLEC